MSVDHLGHITEGDLLFLLDFSQVDGLGVHEACILLDRFLVLLSLLVADLHRGLDHLQGLQNTSRGYAREATLHESDQGRLVDLVL